MAMIPYNYVALGPPEQHFSALNPGEVELQIAQIPEVSPISGQTRTKSNRRVLDPPVFIEMKIPAVPNKYINVHNPRIFCVATLVSFDHDNANPLLPRSQKPLLSGTTTSSLHRLKPRPEDEYGAYFVFTDLSISSPGNWRLRFTVYDIPPESITIKYLQCIDSPTIRIVQNKDFNGNTASTALSKSFADQGIRMRIRKEAGREKSGAKRHRDSSDNKDSMESDATDEYIPPPIIPRQHIPLKPVERNSLSYNVHLNQTPLSQLQQQHEDFYQQHQSQLHQQQRQLEERSSEVNAFENHAVQPIQRSQALTSVIEQSQNNGLHPTTQMQGSVMNDTDQSISPIGNISHAPTTYPSASSSVVSLAPYPVSSYYAPQQQQQQSQQHRQQQTSLQTTDHSSSHPQPLAHHYHPSHHHQSHSQSSSTNTTTNPQPHSHLPVDMQQQTTAYGMQSYDQSTGAALNAASYAIHGGPVSNEPLESIEPTGYYSDEHAYNAMLGNHTM